MAKRRPDPYGERSMERPRASDLVEAAVVTVASVPGGIHRSVLWAAVAAHLAEMDPHAAPPEPDRVVRALGMCIVRGTLDDVDGRVVTVTGAAAPARA